jgi:hypothetical protein
MEHTCSAWNSQGLTPDGQVWGGSTPSVWKCPGLPWATGPQAGHSMNTLPWAQGMRREPPHFWCPMCFVLLLWPREKHSGNRRVREEDLLLTVPAHFQCSSPLSPVVQSLGLTVTGRQACLFQESIRWLWQAYLQLSTVCASSGVTSLLKIRN